MKLFGYEQNVEEGRLLELSESTIAATSDEVRHIADFLYEVAKTMDRHGSEFGHDHFRDYCNRQEIAGIAGTCDLIVARPLD